MGFTRKTSSGKSLSLYDNDPGSSDICRSAGTAPINKQGQVTDKTGDVQNWPFTPSQPGELVDPQQLGKTPRVLSPTPSTTGRDGSHQATHSPTLG